MIRSLFAGVAGLKNHQTRMDVVANNIANVNTAGFKGSRVTFQDMVNQLVSDASAPQGNRGGTNPQQVGLGMGVSGIDTVFTDGSLQSTGKNTDIAISGAGFFILSDGARDYYTRSGAFEFDTEGNYGIPGSGLQVKGWMADGSGNINNSGQLQNIKVPSGQTMAASPTDKVTYTKNLSADADMPKIVTTHPTMSKTLTEAETRQLVIDAVAADRDNTVADADGLGYTTTVKKPDGTEVKSHISFKQSKTATDVTNTTPVPADTAADLKAKILARVTALTSPTVTATPIPDNINPTGYTTTNTANPGVTTTYQYSQSSTGGGFDTLSTTVATAVDTTPAGVNAATLKTNITTIINNANALPNTVATPIPNATNPTGYTIFNSATRTLTTFQYSESAPGTDNFDKLKTTTAVTSAPAAAPADTAADLTAKINAAIAALPANSTASNVTATGYKVKTINADGSIVEKEYTYSERTPGSGNFNDVTTRVQTTPAFDSKTSVVTTTAVGTTVTAPISAFDSEGVEHKIAGTFTKLDPDTNPNQWTFEIGDKTDTGLLTTGGPYTITFYDDGTFRSVTPNTPVSFKPTQAAGVAVNIDFSAITQYAGASTATVTSMTGYGAGVLNGTSIDSTGTIIGKFSNGMTRNLAQIALATFNNPAGLTKSGTNLYSESNNSGMAQVSAANTGGAGGLTPSNLEMSNVNLAEEFSNMIITQRGFQANSKMITTSDEMLETLTNLKR